MLKTLNVWKDEQTELRVMTYLDDGQWIGTLVEVATEGVALKLSDTGAVVVFPMDEIHVIGREADEWEAEADDGPEPERIHEAWRRR